MNDEKLLIIAKKLQEERVVSFRLYNALYIITSEKENVFIHQEGIDVVYTYSSLNELLEKYVVYGSKLFYVLDDIILC